MSTFRTRIRELRESSGYKSQQSFADSFGVAQSTVGGWESGKREPNYETTLRLAQFFGVSVDYLLGRDDDPNPSAPPPTTNDIDDIRFALFGDAAEEITDEDMEDVRLVVELIKRRKQDKKEGR